MSYLEKVLQYSTALWKQQEEGLQQRLRLLAYRGNAQGESQLQESKNMSERLQEKLLGKQGGETADGERAGLLQKAELQSRSERIGGIRSTVQKSLRESAEKTSEQMLGESTVLSAASWAGVQRTAGGSEAQWLQETLKNAGLQGLTGTSGRQVVSAEAVQDIAGAELLSRSLERDVRRYDGNFLLY